MVGLLENLAAQLDLSILIICMSSISFVFLNEYVLLIYKEILKKTFSASFDHESFSNVDLNIAF